MKNPAPADPVSGSSISKNGEKEISFKTFQYLMQKKVKNILLISSPYDAFIMDEDGRLAERINKEYKGLNLSKPPNIIWASTPAEAMAQLDEKYFDFVITMPQVDQMDAFELGRRLKARYNQNLPVFLLTHNTNQVLISQLNKKITDKSAIDKVYVWLGNSDLLLALVKSIEDRLNVDDDTRLASVRVVIVVEDSPYYRSTLLPLLYKEIVSQTRRLISRSINEEHRLLRMRARPKILVAESYEAAMELYDQYREYLLCMISDVRFPKNGDIDPRAGVKLLSAIKKKSPNIPLLMFSSEEENRQRAAWIPAVFLNKNSRTLYSEIHDFFMTNLGFGKFIFRSPAGEDLARATTLRDMEKILAAVPDDSIMFHAKRRDFSTWLMAHAEIGLASEVRATKAVNAQQFREYLIDAIRGRRQRRQRGIISDFTVDNFDPDFDFIKVGAGSLGGKARGLAFMTTQLKEKDGFRNKYPEVRIRVPKTIVICADVFDAFIQENKFDDMVETNITDKEILNTFFSAKIPSILWRDLSFLLSKINYPLAIRSSSLLEDAQFRPCAGLYNTYMLPNNHADLRVRLRMLVQAIKLVYASTYLEAARAFAHSSIYQTENEKMAVVIQELIGSVNGHYYYPDISGVVQSYNYYPIGRMKADEGIAHIALGLGKTVVDGFSSLRFSPKYPRYLPQLSTIKDILETSQRQFYALDPEGFPKQIDHPDQFRLVHLDIDDARDHKPVQRFSSTYYPADDRIRDVYDPNGYPVLTFAGLLKYRGFPLAELLRDILKIGRKGMGSPVEIEFAVNLSPEAGEPPEFAVLQIRPMVLTAHKTDVFVTDDELADSRIWSKRAMGAADTREITDIVYVKPDAFDPAKTVRIGEDIKRINRMIIKQDRCYLLIGPGRWGSADPWLGIPVVWNDISGACSIIETAVEKLKPDPSQGSHFFHNITSLGVGYFTISSEKDGYIDWSWLRELHAEAETDYVRHVRLYKPKTLKIDGRNSVGVLI